MIPDERLQELITSKDVKQARKWTKDHSYSEGWCIVDGCLVIYDLDDCPKWISEKLDERDDNGNTSAFYNESERTAAK